MKVVIILALLGMALAQDEVPAVDEIPLDASVATFLEWPQNDDTNAGAIVNFVYADIGNGSCFVNLPSPVNLFHVMNGHIVPGDQTNPIAGRYMLAAPADWEAVNGTLNTLIIFGRDDVFNITDIEFRCDPLDEAEISIYSFPQNNLVKEASSNVFYRPGFHKGDVLTITLPSPVARFNFTGGDSEYVISSEGDTTFIITGFKNEEGVDDHKEVHFSIDYLPNENGTVGDNWFSAGQIVAFVTQEEPE